MERLGPFEPFPRLAVAVSGGADSMALVLLARDWASRRGGDVLALIVDHGLRPESEAEAGLTSRRLTAKGIPCRNLSVPNLARGSALAERAREARYRLLLDACSDEGIAHLLLGHHRGDQAETIMMRVLAGSATRGIAGMPGLVETRYARLLRPLLNIATERLRCFLAAQGVDFVEDPSNRDPHALRARLRMAHADPAGTGEGTQAIAQAARAAGRFREERDRDVARILAMRATIWPEGHAFLTPGPIDPDALAALLATVAGAPHAPPAGRVAVLARSPRPATLGGVRILPGGRLGCGWLFVRERRRAAGPVVARAGAIWDGRFRLTEAPPEGLAAGPTMGALGDRAAEFRDRRGLPAAVLHVLPALWMGEVLVAAPHIGIGDPRWRLLFSPRNRAAGAPFMFG